MSTLAEESGWDGVFIPDCIAIETPAIAPMPAYDPWVTLAAMAMRTQRVRLGTMLTCPDYGIADVSEMVHAFPDAIHLMAQTLRHTIRTYEPRLQNVQVLHVPSEGADLTLRFVIQARVVAEGTKRAIQFETLLDASRRFTIR